MQNLSLVLPAWVKQNIERDPSLEKLEEEFKEGIKYTRTPLTNLVVSLSSAAQIKNLMSQLGTKQDSSKLQENL